MRKVYLLVFIFGIIAASSFVISDSKAMMVGAPLCGPICSNIGPHYWEQNCLGFVRRKNYHDAYIDHCWGIPNGHCRVYDYAINEEGGIDMNRGVLVSTNDCDRYLH